MKKVKLFVVSDIHGHYTLLHEALDAAGFDPQNEGHLFVCCGDLFDRGMENRRVYEYIRRLPRRVLVCGNHDERLARVLEEKRIDVYDILNGLDVTLEEFFGGGCIGSYGELTLPPYGKMAGKLRALVGEMVNYYETPHYIFTHGWLPTARGAYPLHLQMDWRNADARAWHSARFTEWMSVYNTAAMPAEKTVVCGHRTAALAAQVDSTRTPEDSSIFYGRGLIAIDACTVKSHRVNVLVLEEEIEEA